MTAEEPDDDQEDDLVEDSSGFRVDFHEPMANVLDRLRASGHADENATFEILHNPSGGEHAGLLQHSRRDQTAREWLVELARIGYFAYAKSATGTRFVRSDAIPRIWPKVRNKKYRMTQHGIVHSLTLPADGRPPGRLLVVFSSIFGDFEVVGLRRYFTQNFRSVQKYVPADTAVLRIGDLGGVVGAFYMNTTHSPDNAGAVQKLLRRVSRNHGIDKDSVVLYGASKGGTGALYHGLAGDYRFISVDPIIDDAFYEDHMNDGHYTKSGGVFIERKERSFARLFDKLDAEPPELGMDSRSSVICSERSPIYPTIHDVLIKRYGNRIAFFNSCNPSIQKHPDVSKFSLNIATMLMNMHLYGMDVPPGLKNWDQPRDSSAASNHAADSAL